MACVAAGLRGGLDRLRYRPAPGGIWKHGSRAGHGTVEGG